MATTEQQEAAKLELAIADLEQSLEKLALGVPMEKELATFKLKLQTELAKHNITFIS